MPIIRSLWLHYPDDPAAIARGDEFLWGRDILVAPVVERGAASRRLYLPRGAWFDFWTNERTEGGREIDRLVDLETMPLYVRAGAIVPIGPLRQYTDEPVNAPTTLTIYPGADGRFALYDDDGKSFNYRKGEWLGIAMEWRDKDRRLALSLAPGSKMLSTAARSFDVKLAGSTNVRSVTFDGRPVSITLS
jgi:alpha-glucosidase/alpha-D-xyloside xylohydrolase